MMSEKRYFTHKEGMTYTGMGDTSFSCLMSGAVIQDKHGSIRYYDKADICARMEYLKNTGSMPWLMGKNPTDKDIKDLVDFSTFATQYKASVNW